MNEREELEKLRDEKDSLVKRLDDALALRKKHVADAAATIDHVRAEHERLKADLDAVKEAYQIGVSLRKEQEERLKVLNKQLTQANMVINDVHYHIHAEHCDIRKASALITAYWNKTQKEAK